LLLTGKSEKEVAKALGISVNTVHVHVRGLYKRLEVTTRAELLARCLGGPSRTIREP
jgi:DNA-binding CsgD family transcriptional regulator